MSNLPWVQKKKKKHFWNYDLTISFSWPFSYWIRIRGFRSEGLKRIPKEWERDFSVSEGCLEKSVFFFFFKNCLKEWQESIN